MRICKNDLICLMSAIACMMLLGLIYYFYGYSRNAYVGMKQLKFGIDILISIIVFIIYYKLIFVTKLHRPSDGFILIYSIIVIFPYLVLHSIDDNAGSPYGFRLFILLTPPIVLKIIRSWTEGVSIRRIYLSNGIPLSIVCVIFVFITSALILTLAPTSASFSLNNSYVRRIDARVAIPTGSAAAYASAMLMNGIGPFLAYIGVLRRRLIFLIIAFGGYLSAYYVYGVKAPLFYIGLAIGFAWLDRNRIAWQIPKLLLLFLSFIMATAGIEIVLIKYSIIEDYFIRRAFYIGSQMINAYFGVFTQDNFSSLRGLFGQDVSSASMYVGNEFLGRVNLNANTNTFLYYMIQGGIIGYVLCVMLVTVVYMLFDILYKHAKDFMYLGFVYGLLIVEQSATTAFISSGIGLIAITLFFARPIQVRYVSDRRQNTKAEAEILT